MAVNIKTKIKSFIEWIHADYINAMCIPTWLTVVCFALCLGFHHFVYATIFWASYVFMIVYYIHLHHNFMERNK
jgi:hypothetical protein